MNVGHGFPSQWYTFLCSRWPLMCNLHIAKMYYWDEHTLFHCVLFILSKWKVMAFLVWMGKTWAVCWTNRFNILLCLIFFWILLFCSEEGYCCDMPARIHWTKVLKNKCQDQGDENEHRIETALTLFVPLKFYSLYASTFYDLNKPPKLKLVTHFLFLEMKFYVILN